MVEVHVPPTEHERWEAEAKRRELAVGEWLRVLGNFALDAEVEGEPLASLGRRRLLAEVAMNCVGCGKGLGFQRTARKRYCSPKCRVAAWRMRQRGARKVSARVT